MVVPAAAMVNLLGSKHVSGEARGLERARALGGAHVHLYGKSVSAPGRKMGHVTALGQTVAEAILIAQSAAAAIHFGNLE
jgi:5-(carboxyamino)imidazole ribonucleotide synthase